MSRSNKEDRESLIQTLMNPTSVADMLGGGSGGKKKKKSESEQMDEVDDALWQDEVLHGQERRWRFEDDVKKNLNSKK